MSSACGRVGLGVVSSRDIEWCGDFSGEVGWIGLGVLTVSWEVYNTENDPLFIGTCPLLLYAIDTCIDQITRSSRRPYHVRPSSHPVDAPSVSLGSIIDFDPGPSYHQFYPYRLLFYSRFSTCSNICICIGIGRGHLPSRPPRQLGPADNPDRFDHARVVRSYFEHFGCTGRYGYSGCPDGGRGGGCGPLCA